uniref:Transcription factor domain-containing protein n=1 Tax=Bionectria ochroleuca TaxID=29856 RepID=A0A8H7K957_BIOOC
MRSSEKFAYSMINQERENLIKDFPNICSKPDIWVLASVHAMCVYQIVGFFGKSPEQVLQAQLQQPWLLKMTRYLARTQATKIICAPQETWESWALSETIRRTILLVNSINSLSCRVGRQDPRLFESLDDELVFQSPLPAAIDLWRAKTASEWTSKKLSMSAKAAARETMKVGTALEGLSLGEIAGYSYATDPDQYSRMVVDLSRLNYANQKSCL